MEVNQTGLIDRYESALGAVPVGRRHATAGAARVGAQPARPSFRELPRFDPAQIENQSSARPDPSDPRLFRGIVSGLGMTAALWAGVIMIYKVVIG